MRIDIVAWFVHDLGSIARMDGQGMMDEWPALP